MNVTADTSGVLINLEEKNGDAIESTSWAISTFPNFTDSLRRTHSTSGVYNVIGAGYSYDDRFMTVIETSMHG